jgi:hypothetical protein
MTIYQKHHSREQTSARSRKRLSRNAGAHLTEHDVISDIVVNALWKSFPECHSENEIAEAAAPYFRDRYGNPISTRTVRNWLRGEVLPSALHLMTLAGMQPKLFLTLILGSSE